MERRPQETNGNPDQLLDEIVTTYFTALEAGETPDRQVLLLLHPTLARPLQDFFDDQDHIDSWAGPLRAALQPPRLSPGDGRAEVPGDYELLEEIGRGGMGVVYRARQRSLDRLVALKMIRESGLASAAERQRFRAEAEVVAGLDHPHLVPIYEVGELAGQPYFTMKLLLGGSLEHRRSAYRSQPRTAARLVAQVADTVHHAHQHGVLHRDLKPSNILLDDQGQPHVTDFGLAKRVGMEDGLTRTGDVIGTPCYVAPEQALGRREAVTTASDVYSLGAVLYALLTGQPPFRGPTILDTLEMVKYQEPSPPRKLNRLVDRDLETICLKCLAKDPKKRYASAADLARDLHRYLDHVPIRARPAGSVEQLLKLARRRPLWTALLLLGFLSALGLTVLSASLWQSRQDLAGALDQANRATADAEFKATQARESEGVARQNLYASELRIVGQFWKAGDVASMRPLLDRQREGVPDGSGFEWGYYDRLAHAGDSRILDHREGEVLGVAVSPDGRTVVTGGQDGVVRLFDAATRRLRSTLAAHQGPVTGMAYLAEGRTLATWGADHVVRYWDPTTGRERSPAFRFTEPVERVALSADGKLLAAVLTRDRSGHVWEKATGKRIRSVTWGPVTAVALSPDGKKLAAGLDFGFQVLEVHTAQETGPLRGYGAVLAVGFSPNGWSMAAVRRDGVVSVFQTERGALTSLFEWPLQHDFIASRTPLGALDFSPDGATLAIGGDDAVVYLWDVPTRRMKLAFRGHTAQVRSVAFAPGGQGFVTGSADGTARLWEVADCPDYQQLETPLQAAGPIAFSPDGNLLAVASRDHCVCVLDPGTGRVQGTCRGHVNRITALAFALQTSVLATVSADLTLKLWDLPGGQARASYPLPALPFAVAFTQDSRLVAAGLDNGLVKCWETSPGGSECASFVACAGPVLTLAFRPDGKELLAGGSGEARLHCWDVGTRQERPVPWAASHRVRRLALSPDGRMLAVADPVSADVCLWDMTTDRPPVVLALGNSLAPVFSPNGKILAIPDHSQVNFVDVQTQLKETLLMGMHGDEILDAAYHPNGRLFATTSRDGTVRIWDLTAWEMRLPPGQPQGPVRALAFSGDGRRMFVGSAAPAPVVESKVGSFVREHVQCAALVSRSDAVRVWDLDSGREQLPLLGRQPGLGVHALALTPDGQALLAGSVGGTLWRWETTGGRPLPVRFVSSQAEDYWELFGFTNRIWRLSRPEYTSNIRALAVSPNGRYYATATDAGTVQIWDAKQGQVARTLPDKHADLACLAFHPREEILAVNDGVEVRLWDVRTGAAVARLSLGHRQSILALAFSPDGKTLATAGHDRKIFLTDWADPGLRQRVRAGHNDAVSCLAFAPDGRTLASGSWDSTVRLWHLATGQEVATLEGHRGRIHCLVFAADGRTLGSGGETPEGNGEVLLWRADR
jgi:WD40 repeat protein/serine/threonine protein kinase